MIRVPKMFRQHMEEQHHSCPAVTMEQSAGMKLAGLDHALDLGRKSRGLAAGSSVSRVELGFHGVTNTLKASPPPDGLQVMKYLPG